MKVEMLAKLVAPILWADGKVDRDEWDAARKVFRKYGISWKDGKKSLELELEELVRPLKGPKKQSWEISRVVLEDGDDDRALLRDLAGLAFADGKVTMSEVEVLHKIGKSINAVKEVVTGALLRAALKKNEATKVKVGL